MASTLPESSERESETYDTVKLTPAEEAEALQEARERKHYRLMEEEKEARAAELRRMLTERWSYERTREWIESRIAHHEGAVQFHNVTNEEGEQISNAGSLFTLLCYYFSVDPRFIILADEMKIKRPDLRKGLLIAGRIGCGKTSLMRLFQRNQRQVYMILGAKEIAFNWRQAGENAGAYLERLSNAHMLPVNDVQNFYHRFAGLCIDDVGTEDVQNSFGNRASVIADLIEARYYNRCIGPLLHLTTNLTMKDVKEFYGDRVASRLRETMNIIEYKGEDRRK